MSAHAVELQAELRDHEPIAITWQSPLCESPAKARKVYDAHRLRENRKRQTLGSQR